MTNPFDDLESDDDDGRTEEEPDGEEPSSSPNATKPDVTQEPVSSPNPQSRSGTAGEQRSREPTPADSGPAFEYSMVRQRPLYARSETWDDFEKTLRTSITPSLAEEDVVDEATREIHDAVLRLAASKPERVAELVLEARRQSE